MPQKSRENYSNNRQKIKKQLKKNESNFKRAAKSSTERSRECRKRQKSARQDAFQTRSSVDQQPSTSNAQIEPKEQEQIEIDVIDQKLQISISGMKDHARQVAFQTRSNVDPQPSTSNAQIEHKEQEQMEIDAIDPKLQISILGMKDHARQDAFQTRSSVDPQPSTSNAQIEPKEQEQMEIDVIDPKLQISISGMKDQCTSSDSKLQINFKKAAKSSTERSRECRKHKKSARQDEFQTRSSLVIAKSSTERSRECRKRQKSARQDGFQTRSSLVIAKSSTERSRKFRKHKKSARQDEFQTKSSLDQQPSTSGVQIEPTFTAPLHSESRQEQDQQQEEYVRPETYRQIYNEATKEFEKLFLENDFGHVCDVCDRIWYKQDLFKVEQKHIYILEQEFSEECDRVKDFQICSSCRQSVSHGKIPLLSKSNGYKYPDHPPNLPPLDPITERLISPRLPFLQIRRLRHETGTYKIIGQVINVPVEVENMVKQLPRQLDDDYTFNVNIKKHIIHKSSYLSGQVKKRVVKEWLSYMVTTPLYKHYKIYYNEQDVNNIDEQRPSTSRASDSDANDHALEKIDNDNDNELMLGQQHTMLWNESKYLDIAPGQNKQPLSVIYDTYAEELSFPAIYYGHPRIFKKGTRATPFSMATSEIRRKDRRGVTPQHILYMAAKIMRLKVSEGLYSTFKVNATAENITRRMIEDKTFIDDCVEKNLAFLKSIPNSMQYWNTRKKDLFAMIRQLGKPTMFMTLSANEIRWPVLLKILYRLSREGNGVELINPINELRALQRASLVNEDPVTCCIYFNKIVNVIMRIISTKKSYNPFGKYCVVDFFKRIEFQHRGSPHAHILLWLENDPKEAITENMPKTIQLITDLCSVSDTDLPNIYANQVHKHTFTCYKKKNDKCRFNIPYWPMNQTRVLLPITKNDGRRNTLKKKVDKISHKLNEKSYNTLDEFLNDNNMTMEYYLDVIRASLRRATVVYKRNMNELWTNTFNPWIANVLNSNMDLQFIIDEYSCAAYVVEYVNKSNRGVSNLHRQLIELQKEHPDQDFTGLMKKVCINMLNTIEISCQEGAWYLLRQPMSEASRQVIFVPTMWANERVKSHKRKRQMDIEQIDDDSTDVWTLNVLQKYEQRPRQLKDVCLADFAAWYKMINKTDYRMRQHACILRYSNYDMTDKLSEYKREMVTLFVPFRCEHIEITDNMKYLHLFDEHHETIMRKLEEYQKIDINKHLEEYNRLCEDLQKDRDELDGRQEHIVQMMATTDVNNDDINSINVGNLTAVVRQRTNVMTAEDFCEKMRMTNPEQRDFLLTLMNALVNGDRTVQVFFTGVAGSGKTFTLNLAKEVTNRFAQTHTTKTNAYVACASTGKAAVAIGGTTVHSAFRIAISRRANPGMSREIIQTYRNAFAGVKVVFIDEVSMIGADILDKIHSRMGDITGNFDDPFGGMNVIFCGDLRQLPPVNARAIFKPLRDSINGAVLWQSLNFYALTRVMRQSDVVFSTILTKIGNGEALTNDENNLLESRFRSIEWCNKNVASAIRLYHRNCEVEKYNVEAIDSMYTSECNDLIQGYCSDEELVSAKTKLYKLSVTECGGLPYMLKLCVSRPFMINCNIDVEDGLVNGAIGEVKYLEYDEEDETKLKRVWLHFENNDIGAKLRLKSRPLVASRSGVLSKEWTPITKRHATISITSKIKCKRIQFPLSPACALTIHKSQGGTFNEIVFNYHKSQDQQLVYVALSRVTSINGLYLTNDTDDYKFYHSKGTNSPKIIELRNELQRLHNYKLKTVCDEAKQFLYNANNSIMSFNVQSLRTHSADLESDTILQKIDLLALNETWLNDDERVNIEGFKWIIQYKRSDVRAGGVAIYEKNVAKTMATPHILMKIDCKNDIRFTAADKHGDICAAEVIIGNKKCLLVSVYISPNTSRENIELFISRHLIAYSPNVGKISSILEKNSCNDIPIILTGDFNLDISKCENEKFLEFMRNDFDLHLSSDKSPTTLGGSCIDIVFTRHVDSLRCYRYISYFSYHKPILGITTEKNDTTPSTSNNINLESANKIHV